MKQTLARIACILAVTANVIVLATVESFAETATAEKVAKKAKRPVHEVRPILDRLGEQGFIFAGGDDERKYFLLGFLPGIFEFYTVMGPDDERKRRFAELYEEYQDAEFLTKLAGKRPVKITRIIPIQQSLSHSPIRSAGTPCISTKESAPPIRGIPIRDSKWLSALWKPWRFQFRQPAITAS